MQGAPSSRIGIRISVIDADFETYSYKITQDI